MHWAAAQAPPVEKPALKTSSYEYGNFISNFDPLDFDEDQDVKGARDRTDS